MNTCIASLHAKPTHSLVKGLERLSSFGKISPSACLRVFLKKLKQFLNHESLIERWAFTLLGCLFLELELGKGTIKLGKEALQTARKVMPILSIDDIITGWSSSTDGMAVVTFLDILFKLLNT